MSFQPCPSWKKVSILLGDLFIILQSLMYMFYLSETFSIIYKQNHQYVNHRQEMVIRPNAEKNSARVMKTVLAGNDL